MMRLVCFFTAACSLISLNKESRAGCMRGYLDGSMVVDVLCMLIFRVIGIVLDGGINDSRDARP